MERNDSEPVTKGLLSRKGTLLEGSLSLCLALPALSWTPERHGNPSCPAEAGRELSPSMAASFPGSSCLDSAAAEFLYGKERAPDKAHTKLSPSPSRQHGDKGGFPTAAQGGQHLPLAGPGARGAPFVPPRARILRPLVPV